MGYLKKKAAVDNGLTLMALVRVPPRRGWSLGGGERWGWTVRIGWVSGGKRVRFE